MNDGFTIACLFQLALSVLRFTTTVVAVMVRRAMKQCTQSTLSEDTIWKI